MRKFIHAADIHLDSPMRGLPEYPGAPVAEIRGATRRALEAMVDLALEEQVDLVLIAGDLYDGDWPDYNTGHSWHSRWHGAEAASASSSRKAITTPRVGSPAILGCPTISRC